MCLRERVKCLFVLQNEITRPKNVAAHCSKQTLIKNHSVPKRFQGLEIKITNIVYFYQQALFYAPGVVFWLVVVISDFQNGERKIKPSQVGGSFKLLDKCSVFILYLRSQPFDNPVFDRPSCLLVVGR